MLLEAILSVGPPVVLIIGMVAVGLSMTPPVVRKVAGRPGAIAVLTCLQAVFLPVAAVVVILAIDPPAAVSAALLLISACPGGGISNLYVLFARANTSLSVLLTLTSIALAILTLPAALAALDWLGFETLAGAVAPVLLALRLIALILVPVAIGMLLRIYAPGFALRWEERLRNISAVAILAILAAVLWLDRVAFLATFPQMALSTAMFLVLAMAIGTAAGRAFYRSAGDQFAVMIEFAVRNLAIALYVTVSLGSNVAIAGPAATYLFLETVLLILLGLVRRARLRRSG